MAGVGSLTAFVVFLLPQCTFSVPVHQGTQCVCLCFCLEFKTEDVYCLGNFFVNVYMCMLYLYTQAIS